MAGLVPAIHVFCVLHSHPERPGGADAPSATMR